MLLKPAQKFILFQHHAFGFVTISIVFIAKTNHAILYGLYPVAGNGGFPDSWSGQVMRVATQVFQNTDESAQALVWTSKRRFGIYFPILVTR